MEQYEKADVVIVGTGVSGLYAALNLPHDKKIIMITKRDLEASDSFLAQGGICMKRDEDDFDSYFEDTMRAGHYENNPQSVEIMINSSPDVIKDLVHYGVDFERDENGEFAFTREGAHRRPRILYHQDITGKEITTKLLRAVKRLKNVTIYEQTKMLDLLIEDGEAHGIICRSERGYTAYVEADYTILATGGVGGIFLNSTNFRNLTADAIAIGLHHNIEMKDLDYIQIHPTTLYSKSIGSRRFLISESVRGEGAILLNKDGERFTDELQPRDVVTKAIWAQMEKDGTPHVWLDLRPIGEAEIKKHFPNIYKKCLEEGYDATVEPIPVVPAQHYFMGGIKVDEYSKTSMARLYAVGETACNGVHGANRLASNSLLESLVFAKRAALNIAENYSKVTHTTIPTHYTPRPTDADHILVRETMERMKKERGQNNNAC